MTPLCILVADDDPETRRSLSSALTRWGYQFDLADSGLAAWEMLQSGHTPDIVILGWTMRGVDGIEVCRALRMQDEQSQRYVLLLAPEGRDHDVVAAFEAGADEYLVKPLGAHALRERIAMAARGAIARRKAIAAADGEWFEPHTEQTDLEPETPTQATLAGRVVGGRYRVLHPLVSDDRAAVWEAVDTTRGARVAIRFSRRDSFGSRRSAQLGTNPRSAVLDFGLTAGGMPYAVMAFHEGWKRQETAPRRPSQRPKEPVATSTSASAPVPARRVTLPPARYTPARRASTPPPRRSTSPPPPPETAPADAPESGPRPAVTSIPQSTPPSVRASSVHSTRLAGFIAIVSATSLSLDVPPPRESIPPQASIELPCVRPATLAPPALPRTPPVTIAQRAARPNAEAAGRAPTTLRLSVPRRGARDEPLRLWAAPTTLRSDERAIREAMRARDFVRASALLRERLRARPRDAALHARLGAVLTRLGDRNGAITAYRAATEIDYLDVSALRNLSELQAASGDRAAAIASLRAVLSLAPKDRVANALLARLQRR